MNKKIFGWMMFDWASQPFHTLLITFIFAPYFTSAVAPTAEIGQAMWGYMMAGTGVVLALMAPILGAIADTTGPRRPWIIFFSLLYVLGSASLWQAAPGATSLLPILALFAIGLIGLDFATTFTNAYLPEITEPEDIGRVSGSGWAIGYVGGVFALLIMLAFLAENEAGVTMLNNPPAFGLDAEAREGTRAVGPLTAIWYAVFMIPFFLYVPDRARRAKVSGVVSTALRDLGATLRALPGQASLRNYLLSSMFYRDALNGLYAFGGIYAAGVLKWSIVDIGIFGIVAAITGAVGAWLGGRADRAFGPKPVIAVSIILLVLVCITIVATTRTHVFGMGLATGSGLPDIIFYVCGAIIGAAGGALQASSRTMLVHQSREDRMTEAFGLYSLVGKATAFLAPLSIALMTDLTESQRWGISPVIVLFAIGLILLYWVQARGRHGELGRKFA